MLLLSWTTYIFAQTNVQNAFDADEAKFNEQLKALLSAQSSYLEKRQTNELRQVHKQISDLIEQRKYPRAIHALQQAKNEKERFDALDDVAKESLNIGKNDEAKAYADELG